MKIVFLTFFVLSCVRGFTIPRHQYVSVGSFPYIVSIQRTEFHFCSGVILNPNTILSAASCFDLVIPFELPYLRVIAGSSQPNEEGTAVKISSFKIHENYVNINVTYDAVLVQLQEDLEFSDTIAPAVLVDDWTDIPANTIVNITGYGLSQDQSLPPKLKYAEVRTIDKQKCRKIWPQKTANNQLICAGNKEEDVCYGDAGAPMTLGGKLIGYSSLLSCNDGKPSLFTKISSIRSWIKFNTGI